MSLTRTILRTQASMLFAAIFLFAGSASANEITNCDQTCRTNCQNPPVNCIQAISGKCKLANNITCNSTHNGILLQDGRDLDMNDQSIDCPDPNDPCPFAGVRMSANNSRVINLGVDESGISGFFTEGVDCEFRAGGEVNGIRISNNDTAILDCPKIRNNVIGEGDLTIFGTETEGIGTTNYIRNNYINGPLAAIWVRDSPKKVTIEDNIIMTTGNTVYAIFLNGPAKVENNIFMGTGRDSASLLIVGDGTTFPATSFDGNLCDVAHPGCAACEAAGFCVDPIAPFRQ